ncbi:MAG: polyprenyl diphosphate synthase, partial [bacterium]
RAMFNACDDLGIRYITLYSFSTENWSRPEDEINALMELIDMQMRSEAEHLHRKNARIRQLGRVEGLPAKLVETLRYIEELTSQNTGITIQFAINYSGRAELLDAAKKMTRAAVRGELDPETITEDDVAAALYRPDVPDPELVIRTAGEMRVSNYLLWQIAYSEFWVTPIFWPEFRAPHLLEALLNYQQRKRKFGGITA